MSPVNNDDSSGRNFREAGRPLTRKEIRAREKALTAESGDVVPEQAYESGEDTAPEMPGHSPLPAQSAPTQSAPAQSAPAAEAPAPAPQRAPEPVVDPEPVPATVAVPRVPPAPPTVQEPVVEEPVFHANEDLHHADADLHRADEDLHHADAAEPGYQDHHHDVHPDTYEDHDALEHEAVGHQLLANADSGTTVTRPSKKVRRRRRLVALLLSLALFVTAAVVGAQFLKPLLGADGPSDFPGPGTGQVKVAVLPGEGPVSVAAKLEEARVVANADTFVSELAASGGTLAPGEYDFKQEMKNADAVAVLLNAEQAKVMYFALSAGLRIGESLEAISEGSGIPVAQLKALSDSPKQFGLPAKAKNLEGYLAPGEYRFPLGTAPKAILTSLVKSTTDELKTQGVTDPAKQYDVVTVASIVQAEGGQAEYKDVAGAIYNRLKPNNTETAGLIQSDATVTYGLGRKSFHIDEDEKADKSNPYNTYANQGLPVGPIGSPGKTAIDAAAKPNKNEYMYWVTINLDTKETKFSKTLEEHNRYVDQYNAWCEANPGRCV
ncbi:endolytic transglycosylase MltG [Arthrobacter sp. ISL-5]|uniref:endolytic transglycosylase MltG n=1 Tax=Arthrobacter sp. ISL-5 TaxID=2819111 RepID=UPI001BE7B1E5|nr:endolytic transglycosylase MltG [Arthrobacter sp. ISL-5]MBT2554879.1 endolytic transglycosylase MltG [Arthrobacter sp. ISL-5]